MIIVLVFLILVIAFAVAAMVLFQSQHGITYAIIELDEVRYAKEMGLRQALWVWRYKYEDSEYLDAGTEAYAPAEPLPYAGYSVKGACVRVEDKSPADRRLDLGNGEIIVKVLKIDDPDSCSWQE